MILFRLCLLVSLCQLHQIASAQGKATAADSMLAFIKSHPKQVSFLLHRNDSAVAAWREKEAQPLASTVKILVAVEFAKQAASNIFSEDQRIAIKDLDTYYLPNTDGGAHPAWLDEAKKKNLIVNDSISLQEVARGMIMYSSNANTEFLMDLLGLDNIKNNIQLFGLQSHSAIYPLVSSLFLYQNPKQMKEEKVLKAIRGMKEEQYCKFIQAIHQQLKYDTTFKARFRPQDLTENMQRCWSDLLPRASAGDYVHLMKILNNRRFLDSDAYAILADILEFPMESPAVQRMFKQYGFKGGSTAFVLTKAMLATDKAGHRTEFALFFDQLNPIDEQRLAGWLDQFEFQVLFNPSFRNKLKEQLPATAKRN